MPIDYIEKLTEILISKGLILEIGESPNPDFMPTRDIETITISEIINASRGSKAGKSRANNSDSDEIKNIFKKIDIATNESLNGGNT